MGCTTAGRMNTLVHTACGHGPRDGSSARAAALPEDLPPGAHAGPWIIEGELGRGGMGVVYGVVHETIGKRAALKVVHRRVLDARGRADRVLLEARLVNQVRHPNIVDIFETGTLRDGRPYIVMERLDGQSLGDRADDGKLLPDEVIAILLQICDALIAAHAAGVVHRDLKPDNVFLAANPDDPAAPRAKLLDWGIAKDMNHDAHQTIEGQLVGTPQYLSPEQARGGETGPATDVYSLGVMAYELFLEELPFVAETAAELMVMHLRAPPPPPSELWPDVPPRLEELVLAMLAKAPAYRPSIREVARELEAVRDELADRRARACATTRTRGVRAWRPRRPRWRYVVGAAAVVASVALFGVSRAGDREVARLAPIPAPLGAPDDAPPPRARRPRRRAGRADRRRGRAHRDARHERRRRAGRDAPDAIRARAPRPHAARRKPRPRRAGRARDRSRRHDRSVPVKARALGAAAAVAAATLGSPAARADAPVPAKARALAERGRQLHDRGDYGRAIDAFRTPTCSRRAPGWCSTSRRRTGSTATARRPRCCTAATSPAIEPERRALAEAHLATVRRCLDARAPAGAAPDADAPDAPAADRDADRAADPIDRSPGERRPPAQAGRPRRHGRRRRRARRRRVLLARRARRGARRAHRRRRAARRARGPRRPRLRRRHRARAGRRPRRAHRPHALRHRPARRARRRRDDRAGGRRDRPQRRVAVLRPG